MDWPTAIRAFYDYRLTHPVSPQAAALWMRLKWLEVMQGGGPIRADKQLLIGLEGFGNSKQLERARDELTDASYITYKGGKGAPSGEYALIIGGEATGCAEGALSREYGPEIGPDATGCNQETTEEATEKRPKKRQRNDRRSDRETTEEATEEATEHSRAKITSVTPEKRDINNIQSIPNTPEDKGVRGEGNRDGGFEAFWAAYPRHAAIQAAKKAWEKLKPDDALRAKILTAIDQAKRSEQWTKDGGQFIPYPATWLNQRRWDDELPQARADRSAKPNGVTPTALNFQQRRYEDGDLEHVFTDLSKYMEEG